MSANFHAICATLCAYRVPRLRRVHAALGYRAARQTSITVGESRQLWLTRAAPPICTV